MRHRHRWFPPVLSFVLGLATLVGCEDTRHEPKPSAPSDLRAASEPLAPAPAPAVMPQFEGSWAYAGMENIVMVIDPAGKMRMTGLGDRDCIGTYEITGDELRIAYDEGQPHCTNIDVGGKLAGDGKQLQFGMMATYLRK